MTNKPTTQEPERIKFTSLDAKSPAQRRREAEEAAKQAKETGR